MAGSTGLAAREVIVRVVSAMASLVVAVAALIVFTAQADTGVAGPPGPVPQNAYFAIALALPAVVGLIGAASGSRPLIGAAGGLVLTWGSVGSPLVAPAVVLLAACGLMPGTRQPSRREFIAGFLVVILGYSSLIFPALTAMPRCWVAVATPAGIDYRSADDLPFELQPGEVGAGCDGGVPSVAAFPISLITAGLAVVIALRSIKT